MNPKSHLDSPHNADDQRAPKKRKRRRGGFFRFLRTLLFLLLVIAITLIVLSFTGVLGGSIQAKAEATFQNLINSNRDIPVMAETSAPGINATPDLSDTISITDSTITYQGNVVTIDALRDALLTNFIQGTSIKLVDTQAIKADYDAVRALLTELAIPFTEQ